ncbi:MAG: hypothetical protein ICV51_09745 [Flavisolibacter sp.]|nr:hypothetical protein [Flavisolibacter sp.]
MSPFDDATRARALYIYDEHTQQIAIDFLFPAESHRLALCGGVDSALHEILATVERRALSETRRERKDKKQIAISTSALTFANTHYILLKENPPVISREILRKFKILTSVLPLDDKIIDLALNDAGFTDFEDAIQYYSALESGQEVIITRNVKDFKTAQLPVMSATEFLKVFQSA